VGIGTASPNNTLEVNGGVRVDNLNMSGGSNRVVFANANGDLNVNSNTIAKTDPLYIRGSGDNNPIAAIVIIGGNTVVNTTSRGLTLVIVTKATHAVVSATNYDTYGSSAASNSLATALNGINNTQIGILVNYDAWEGQVTTALQSAFQRVGLYKAVMTTVGGARRPYAAIFEASSSSVPSVSATEVEHSSDANEPYAEIRGWLIDGGFVATGQEHSGLSTPIGAFAAGVNESGYVGIGTASPSAQLHTTGTVRFQNYTNGLLSVDANGNLGVNTGSGLFAAGNGLSWNLTTLNSDWTTSGSNIYNNNSGNVGIGTTGPGYLLDIAGKTGIDGANDGAIYMTGTKNTNRGIEWNYASNDRYGMAQASGGNTAIYTSAAYGPSFITFDLANAVGSSFTELMRITHAGNVGIGTTSPAYTLDLNQGTFGFGVSNERTEYQNDAGAGNGATQSGFFQTSAPAPAADWPVGAGSWWHLIDCRHTNSTNNYAMQFAGSFFDQNLYFRKTNGSPTTAWSRVLTTNDIASMSGSTNYLARWTSANTLGTGVTYDNGTNVGIGNTSPGTLLEVGSGGSTGKAVIYSQDNSYGELQLANPASSGEASMAFISGATAIGVSPSSTNGTSYVWDIGAGNYGIGGNKFGIGNQAYGGTILNITSAGNVGIGTTSPGVTLDVNGAICNERNWLYLAAPGDLNHAIGNLLNYNGNDAEQFRYWGFLDIYGAQTGAESRFMPNGNFGVGTTAPGYRLDVAGVVNVQASPVNNVLGAGSRINLATGGSTIGFEENWGVNITGTATQPTRIYNSSLLVGYGNYGTNYGTGNLYVSGNVGIGTTSPGNNSLMVYQPSNVAGTGYATTSVSAIYAEGAASANPYAFGITGYDIGTADRTGGVQGAYSGATWGVLGYVTSGGSIYGEYSTSSTTGTGFLPQGNKVAGIGQGSIGDFIGGWNRGSVIGHIASGELAAGYNMGNVYTSGQQIEIVNTGNARVAAYSNTSTQATITHAGNAQLINGKASVQFDKQFTALLAKDETPIVTITPGGNCNGIHWVNVSAQGFDVEENNGGNSSVPFNYIVIGKRIDAGSVVMPDDFANKDFDKNLKGFMFNEADMEHSATPMWWDGTRIRFDAIPAELKQKKAGPQKGEQKK
jgi:hypothetical protein